MPQVKASHIFLGVPPDATSDAKEAAKKKLAAIKAEIDSGKISFADAANKYSEDDANKGSPNGGDLGYFTPQGAVPRLVRRQGVLDAGEHRSPSRSRPSTACT